MTDLLIKLITKKEDLSLVSHAYKKGELKVNISKISKHLGIDRKTTRNYLKGIKPKTSRNRTKYLDEYREKMIKILNDEFREFDYVDHFYRFMKREYDINCSRVTFNRYIRNNDDLNKLFKSNSSDKFTERFETLPGQQIQFDLKEKVPMINEKGVKTLVYIPTITFGWSRYNYRKIILDTKTETLLSFLAEAFESFGGVPKEIVIDNLKAFVEKARFKNNDAILNSKFEQFCKDYGIIVKPCVARRPQTKGKTETQNKKVDELKNYNGHFSDLNEIHDLLEKINSEDNKGISQATKLPRILLFNKEKGELNPLPSKDIRSKYHLKLSEVHVSKESLISYKSNKYSVPKKYIGFKVGLVVINNELQIYYNNQVVTIHQITNNLLNIKPEHKLNYVRNEEKNTHMESKIIKELGAINYD